jgi:predicted phosphodiesterase
MATPPIKDDDALQALAAYEQAGDFSNGARLLGLNRCTFRRRVRAAHDRGLTLSDGARSVVDRARLSPVEAQGGWVHDYDDEGRKVGTTRWAKRKLEEDPGAWTDALIEGLADAPRAVQMVKPSGPSDLCVVFPVADLHVGMLASQEETGTAWGGAASDDMFRSCFARLAEVTPDAETAILAQLGDLTHTDDQRNVTPMSGHQLDADARYFEILRRAVAAMKYAIDTLRAKYPRVIYRGCRGNHDVTSHHAISMALDEHYRDVEGVEIVKSAGEFYVREFGMNMLVLHHGDKAKPERLVQFAAAEYPQIWGRTKYRVALSGHVHHQTVKEIGGMVFESVGTIIPRDFHAYTHAYSARRSLVSIVFDAEQGEISRARINL